MPSRGSLPSTGRPYTLLTLLTGQRAPPLAKREGSFRFAFRGAKTARPTQARCPPTSLLVRGMRAPICIFVCVGTKLPQRKLVVNSVIPSRLGGPCPPTPPGVVRGVGSRKARGKFLAGPPRGASEMQQLVNENCSDWYKETEMICHAGDPYAGPQAALAKRKEHSRLRRAALSATASASWFFVDSVTPETKPGVTSVGSKPKGTFKKKRDAALSRSKNTINTQLHCNDRIQLTSSMDPSINAFLQATINPLFCGPSDRSLQKWTRSKQRQNILRAVYQELGAFRRRSIL